MCVLECVCRCSHVENAGDISTMVITHCRGSSQGNKRIVAVTGDLADEVICYIFNCLKHI